MKPIKRNLLVVVLATLVAAAALTAGWLTADPGAPPQATAEAPESTTEEPLPDFQPTERLPADSAAAFPTDI
jgi:flagellar basal body-associated protein FliL